MENKNFEYKNIDDAPPHYDNSEALLWSGTYNTCLDRTNAKGIYEVNQRILKHYEEEPMAISYKYDSEYRMDFAKWMASLRVLFNELQTELKKAEPKERNCDWDLPEGECPICDIDPDTFT